MEARRSKNFKEFYKSTGEHSVNIRGHVRLTLLGLLLSTRANTCSKCAQFSDSVQDPNGLIDSG